MTDKTHARDYLIELAEGGNTLGWLRDLIIRLLNRNGQLMEEDITATTEQLKANGEVTLPLPSVAATDTVTEISLTELIHHGVVNVLASEQLKNSIILDDPVNSLDHHITACFVERLVELGNQVIIFSRNILLQDSLLSLDTVHVCTKQEISGWEADQAPVCV